MHPTKKIAKKHCSRKADGNESASADVNHAQWFLVMMMSGEQAEGRADCGTGCWSAGLPEDALEELYAATAAKIVDELRRCVAQSKLEDIQRVTDLFASAHPRLAEQLLRHRVADVLTSFLVAKVELIDAAQTVVKALAGLIAALDLSRLSADVLTADLPCNGSEAIVTALRIHIGDPEFAADCCDLLAKLCTLEENRAPVAAASGGQVLLDAIRRHDADANVTVAGLTALAELAHSPELVPGLLHEVPHDGAALIVALLRRHIDDSAVVQQACRTLFLLTSQASDLNAAVVTGLPAVLCAVLDHHCGDAATVAVVLAEFCAAYYDIVSAAADAGASADADASVEDRGAASSASELMLAPFAALGPHVVNAFKRHFSVADSEVLVIEMCTIRFLACYAPASIGPMIAAGAVKALTAAMRRFPTVARLQAGCCRALSSLVQEDDVAAMRLELDAGVGDLAVHALQRFVREESVALHATACLATLAHDVTSVNSLLDAGAGEALEAVVRAVVKEAQAAAAASASEAVAAAGAAEEASASLSLASLAARVRTASLAIGFIGDSSCRSRSALKIVASSPWLQLLLDAVKHLGFDPSALRRATATMGLACEFETALNVLLRSGAPRELLAAIPGHVDDAPVVAGVSRVIAVMLDTVDESRVPVLTEEGSESGSSCAHVKMLVLALQVHADDIAVASDVSSALSLVARRRENAAALIKCGAVDAISNLMLRRRSKVHEHNELHCIAALMRMSKALKPPAALPLPPSLGGAVAETLAKMRANTHFLQITMLLLHNQLSRRAFFLEFCAAGGVKTLTAILAAFLAASDGGKRALDANNAGMVMQTRDLVLQLVKIRGTSPYFMQAGYGVQAVVNLRKALAAEDGNNWESACERVYFFTWHDEDACSMLARLGICEEMLRVLPAQPGGDASAGGAAGSSFCTDEPRAVAAITVLRNIAASPEARPALMKCAAPAAVIASVRFFLRNAASSAAAVAQRNALCAASCSMLRNLAAGPEYRAALAAAGACDLVRSAVSLERSSSEAVLAACGLLFGLACELVNCRPLLENGFATDCLAVLQRFPSGSPIGWAVSGVMLRFASACAASRAGAGDADDCWAVQFMPLLQEASHAALARHGATDARVASAAVAAVQQLAEAARGTAFRLSASLVDAVRATLAAHELIATAEPLSPAGRRSADVVARCREFLGAAAGS